MGHASIRGCRRSAAGGVLFPANETLITVLPLLLIPDVINN